MTKRRESWEMTKAEGAKFRKRVLTLLKRHGAAKNTGEWASMYNTVVHTPAGDLMLDTKKIETGTVFGRFANVKKGTICSRGDSNPYSGKWNHHFGRRKAVHAGAEFARALDSVTSCKMRQ